MPMMKRSLVGAGDGGGKQHAMFSSYLRRRRIQGYFRLQALASKTEDPSSNPAAATSYVRSISV